MSKGTTQRNTARDDDKKYNGALYIYRRDLIYLRDKIFKNTTEYGQYNILLRCAVWDIRKETFGTVFKNAVIASLIGVSASTIWRWKTIFLKKGLLKQWDDGTIRFPEAWKYKEHNVMKLSRERLAKSQGANANLQASIVKPQLSNAAMQKSEPTYRNGRHDNLRLTKPQTTNGIASLQSLLGSKETINKRKKTIKADIAFSCKACGEGVTRFVARLLKNSGYEDQICWSCNEKRRKPKNEAA